MSPYHAGGLNSQSTESLHKHTKAINTDHSALPYLFGCQMVLRLFIFSRIDLENYLVDRGLASFVQIPVYLLVDPGDKSIPCLGQIFVYCLLRNNRHLEPREC